MTMPYDQRFHTDHIVIHCSATDPSWHGRVTASDIDEWHRERGWDGIGYHFYIDRDGVLELGRPLLSVGAHVQGYNGRSVGICLEGGVEVDHEGGVVTFRAAPNFTENQMITLHTIVETLEAGLKADVCGHRDFPGVSKDCPSFDVRHWYETGEVIP